MVLDDRWGATSAGALPGLSALEALTTSADIRDRAFAASVLSIHRHTGDRGRIALLYGRIRETARGQHRAVRARIRDRTLDKHAFVDTLREAPLDVRDHLVEEILDIAYPPLHEASLPREAVPYCPSGLSEILFALQNADLQAGKTFVDLGSGLGKVALLVALLSGAHAVGVELDACLVAHARTAARSLRLDNAHFVEGDIRHAPLPPADVYYMYSPVIGSTAVVARLATLAAAGRILVFSPAVDVMQLPWLRATDRASYWMEMYEGLERAPCATA